MEEGSFLGDMPTFWGGGGLFPPRPIARIENVKLSWRGVGGAAAADENVSWDVEVGLRC